MRRFITGLAIVLISLPAFSLDIGGISLPDSLKTESGQNLLLNGAGIRNKWFMDLYVGGLYLKEKQADADSIIAAQEPMAIRLHITSDMITSERMTDATREGFEHSTQGNEEPIMKEISTLLDSFKQPIQEGDIFDFVYLPQKGVTIFKNDGLLQHIDTGDDKAFKEALFGIWLCDKPAQKSLKKAMLGQ